MAGVSMKDIKSRIKSMESTKQITKAMEMVAASKLRGAQERAIASRPYFEVLYQTIHDIADANTDLSSPFVQEPRGEKYCFVVIAGDRGLAGGYNNNVLKLAYDHMNGKEAAVLPIGKKAVDFFKARKIPALMDNYREAEELGVSDCFTAAKQLCKAYQNREVDEILVVYTNFVSVLSQTPVVLKLLPLENTAREGKNSRTDILYEPDSTEALERIEPEYLGGALYGALCESRAAEQAARRTAMDSATQNADEMIADLSLKFNRARQAAITQEITEIVAGA